MIMPTPWGFVVALFAFYYYRKIAGSSQDKETGLTIEEKIIIIMSLFLEPIWAGLIYYFGLKPIYPRKATQIAKYALAIFMLESIILVTILVFFFVVLFQAGSRF